MEGVLPPATLFPFPLSLSKRDFYAADIFGCLILVPLFYNNSTAERNFTKTQINSRDSS